MAKTKRKAGGRNKLGAKKPGVKPASKPNARRFVKNRLIHQMTNKDAAEDAGYSESVARNTKHTIWQQDNVRAQYQDLVKKCLPPDKVERIYNELLEGRVISKTVHQERVTGPNGQPALQTISAVVTDTIDRNVQLRALRLAAEHGALVPTSVRAEAISPASLEEVLERAEKEYIKHGEMMTPSWIQERAKLRGETLMAAPAVTVIDVQPTAAETSPVEPVAAETVSVTPIPEAESVEEDTCDGCGTVRCAHGRCPNCEVCETCEVPAATEAVTEATV